METNELAHNLFQCCTEEEKARQPKCSKNLGFPPKSKKQKQVEKNWQASVEARKMQVTKEEKLPRKRKQEIEF